MQIGIGRWLGFVLMALRVRDQVIRENLQFAYPGDSAEEARIREHLRRAAYEHLGQLVFEILMLMGPLPRYVRQRSELRGAENWRAAQAAGKGVLFLSSHVGNWEIMAATGAQFSRMDLMIVTKRLKPRWLHRAIELGRLRCGFKGTYEPRTLRDVLAHLKRKGTVGFVLDQYVGPPVGVRVPVFGVPVGTSAAVATLARRTGAVVLPVLNYRTSDGRWIVQIQPAVQWITDAGGDPDRELAQNTAEYARILEQHIYSHPEQWLWTHRRFKGDLSPLQPEEWSRGRARR